MQNMILSIGPGTPAACVSPSLFMSDSLSESEDDDDDGSDEDSGSAPSDDNDDDDGDGEDGMAELDDDDDDEEEDEEQEDEEEELQILNDDEQNGNDGGGESASNVNESNREQDNDDDVDDHGTVVADEDSMEPNEATMAAGMAAAADMTVHIAHAVLREAGGDVEAMARSGAQRLRRSGGSDDDDGDGDYGDESERASGRRSRWTRRRDDHDNDDDDEVEEDQEEEDLLSAGQREMQRAERYIDHLHQQLRRHRRRRQRQRDRLQARDRANRERNGVDANGEDAAGQEVRREVARSMKQGGCINTACWLDCNWRISTVSHEDSFSIYDYCSHGDGFITSSSFSSNNTNDRLYDDSNGSFSSPRRRQTPQYGTFITPTSCNECPTQLLTSGDDQLVKFWDVSQSMGSLSPLPGGPSTVTPFSSHANWKPSSELVSSWKERAGILGSGGRRIDLPGIVHPLLTLSTNHRGNIFHVSPVPLRPGKVVSCAADGYLMLSDVECRASGIGDFSFSSVILSPEYQNEIGESESALHYRHSLMCFSHEFINSNVGLVCSERGLLHFDLRLPARSQHRGSVVEEMSRTCKACKVWNAYDVNGRQDGEEAELESSYVFAGGSGCDVVLYDLRMTGDFSCQEVQRFRPRPLRGKSNSVSVSGIDLSKDKRELLISYENDQIYTFPIFPNASSAAGPSLSDINAATAHDMEEDGESSNRHRPVPELAAYGGHLNRLTFLKMAKYAGPRDEYICTGSDSGHAWIYEKKTGSVVSFLKADNSTCNGIVPHPTLPYFITYGIDSTAKLWRASNPVDDNVDDTDLGRFAYSQKRKYQKSMIVDQWKSALRRKAIDLDDEDLSYFPDEIPEAEEDTEESFFGGIGLLFVRARFGTMQGVPYIGNDMKKLPLTLTQNYAACARACSSGDDEPVRSGLLGLKRRVSLIKLRHHADALGLAFDCGMPWILKHKEHLLLKRSREERNATRKTNLSYGSLADLIPNNPSSWLPFDKYLSNPPQVGGMVFNKHDYEKFYRERYADESIISVGRSKSVNVISQVSSTPTKLDISSVAPANVDIDAMEEKAHGSGESSTIAVKEEEVGMSTSDKDLESYISDRAWDILYQTVAVLKEAGNEAVRSSLYSLAARRYDKAINYCSIAYLEFQVGNCAFLAEHQIVISGNGGYECRWSPLFKLLIQVRLNLSMCFMKEEMNDVKSAISQATTSIKELKPFSTEKGVVLTGKRLDRRRGDEPESTYLEAKSLEAKALFRLGSAQLSLGDYDDAVKSLYRSIKASGDNLDKAVLRKLNEARRGSQEKKESQKRKFKFMFGSSINENDDNETLEEESKVGDDN